MQYYINFKDKAGKLKLKDLNNRDLKKHEIKAHFKVYKDEQVENKKLWNQINKIQKEMIEDWYYSSSTPLNEQGGYITDPQNYLYNRFGETFTRDPAQTKILSYVGAWTMDDYEVNVGNYTLVSASNIFIYWAINGKSQVPTNKDDIYRIVREEGVKLGWTANNGLWPQYNDSLITDSWRRFGYNSGNGYTLWVWSWSDFTGEINANRPGMISINSVDPYRGHTVTLKGYTEYVKTGWSDRRFFVIKDGWDRSDRYLYYGIEGELCTHIMVFTKVNPPN